MSSRNCNLVSKQQQPASAPTRPIEKLQASLDGNVWQLRNGKCSFSIQRRCLKRLREKQAVLPDAVANRIFIYQCLLHLSWLINQFSLCACIYFYVAHISHADCQSDYSYKLDQEDRSVFLLLRPLQRRIHPPSPSLCVFFEPDVLQGTYVLVLPDPRCNLSKRDDVNREPLLSTTSYESDEESLESKDSLSNS